MARPSELRNRVLRSINFENDDYLEFEKYVGRDNVSKEIRALVKNFVVEQKKGEASSDPLNQVRLTTTNSDLSIDGTNITLDIYLLSKKDIVKYISAIDDVQKLAEIEDKANVCCKVARKKKVDILPRYKYMKEHNLSK